ncbi:MAG TPA: metal ABC transporter permease [Alphaproteobacteria bacterium]|jgi:zinc/manganese transport system permease protein
MTAIEILLPAFALSVLLIVSHVYFGLHVLARGIIFVDLALAQVAALGISIGFLLGYDPRDSVALVFAFVGAVLAAAGFAALRAMPGTTGREVVIGCVYVVATALSIMILSGSGQGTEELKAIFNGSILFVRWHEIALVAGAYGVLALLLAPSWRRFQALSGIGAEERPGLTWEFLFFLSFAAMITIAVYLAGILVVFAFLIIPAFAASLLLQGFVRRLAAGWAIGIAGALCGLAAAYILDLPVGPGVVAALSLLLAVAGALRAPIGARL